MDTAQDHSPPKTAMWTRVRQASGTVYGDIGTSVLYTIMEITRETILLKNEGIGRLELKQLYRQGGELLTQNEMLGGLSIVFWALVFLSVKYDLMVMRADHRGEGGTFALWSLLQGYTGKLFAGTAVSMLVISAAALLAADAMITPPVSMLGAFEPLGPSWSVLMTLACLAVLFKVQWRGTSRIGDFFGWFMIAIWFPWIALKGLPWVIESPEVFWAINPLYALTFLFSFPLIGTLVIMGVAVLAITGGEAKFADIGHFSTPSSAVQEGESVAPHESGRMPVMYSWFFIVMPCLLVCYAGQVGYMLSRGVPPGLNTFYAITPQTGAAWFDDIIHYADVAIAGVAAIIASQALITGMFSLANQATAIGVLPRFRIIHTDAHGEGQVYIPAANWALFVGCVVATLVFQSAANLVAAYGIAVTGSMTITTIIFGYVAYYRLGWKLPLVLAVCGPLLLIDMTFFISTTLKIASGGYMPLFVAVMLVQMMIIWQWGRRKLGQAYYNFGVKEGKKLSWLIALRDMLDDIELSIQENLPAARQMIQGRRRLVESDRAAMFLCSRPILSEDDYVPIVMRVFLKKYGVLPSQVVLMHVDQQSVAHVPRDRRYRVIKLGNNIDSVIVTYGYMDQPDVRRALRDLQRMGELPVAAERWIIEVGEEDIILARDLDWLTRLRAIAFSWLLRVSTPAHKYLGLVYDAAISKEVVPVVFGPKNVKVALPELELVQ